MMFSKQELTNSLLKIENYASWKVHKFDILTWQEAVLDRIP